MNSNLWTTFLIFLSATDFVPIFSNARGYDLDFPEDIDQYIAYISSRRRRTRIPETTTEINRYNETIDVKKLVCLDDYEKAAYKVLDKNAKAYYEDGADEQITLRENKLAYKRLTIKPRALVDVSNRKLNKIIFGKEVSFPFGVSPMSLQKMATPEGEAANAKAAASMGVIFTLSTLSNTKIEDVAKAAPNGRKWMQIYVSRNRSITENLMQRAEANGFEALVITIDTPILGKRRENIREPFYLPMNLTIANFGPEMGIAPQSGNEGLYYASDQLLDPTLTWRDIRWMKSKSRIPVIVKGLLSPKDAELAIQSQVDGIFVSNHGGRQLDTVAASIDALPEIVKVVDGRCPIIIDGGVRLGTDIFKALALGADIVFAGRPLLWGLAVNGEQGAKKVIQILKDEFNSTMALSGVQNVAQITEDFIGRSVSPQPRYLTPNYYI